jgi:hypothetical protein
MTYQFAYTKFFNGEKCITTRAPRDCFDGTLPQNSFLANSILTELQVTYNADKEKNVTHLSSPDFNSSGHLCQKSFA